MNNNYQLNIIKTKISLYKLMTHFKNIYAFITSRANQNKIYTSHQF